LPASLDYMVYDEAFAYNAEDTDKPKREKKKPKVRPKRCSVCRQNVESDGYGEYIHSNTGLYCDYDEKGNLTHVATR
jgi:hypothetical protein